MSNARHKLPGLHSLRGIAALMIVVFHVSGIPQLKLPDQLLFINNYFGLGVALFFTISAFSLFLSTYHRVGDEWWIQTYFIKRFFRVAPLFYLMLLVYIVIYYLVFNVTYSFSDIFLNISFLYNFFPGKHESLVWAGWTLGVEMLFYLFLPYFMMIIKSIRGAFVISLFFIFISIIARGTYEGLDLPASYSNISLLTQLGVFSAGIPAYFIYMKYRDHVSVERLGQILLVCAVLLAAFIVTYLAYVLSPIYVYGILPLILGLLILSQLFYPFILITNKVFIYMGEISFSLYLLHPLLVYALRPFYKKIYGYEIYSGYAFLLCVTLTLLLLVPLAHIAYRLVETRSVFAGNWLIRNRLKSG